MKKVVFGILGILVSVFLFSCDYEPGTKEKMEKIQKTDPEYFGQGVYHFSSKGSEETFCQKLAIFLADGPKRLIAITKSVSGYSYIVVVEVKNKPETSNTINSTNTLFLPKPQIQNARSKAFH